MRKLIAVVICLVAGLAGPVLADSLPSPASVAAEIRAGLAGPPPRDIDGQAVATPALRAVYAAFGQAPLWQLNPKAEADRQALEAALTKAPDQGMRADDLHLDALARLAHPATAHAIAERDLLLTDAALRYADKLRRGAVGVEALGSDWHIAPDAFDAATALIDALRAGRIAEFLRALPPPDPQYAGLLAAFRRYRAHNGAWRAIPARDEVKLDGRDPRQAALRARLAAEGYLPAGTADTDLGAIKLAVRLFQARHGLDPDARVGVKTLAELNITPAERANQIAANLERWRHLPRQLGERHVAVNLGGATLDLFDNGTSVFHTRVIIGDARHQSPMFRAAVTGITFNPPWNVPPSIATREMLPRLRRDPHYLAANDIVIVGRGDDPFGLRVNWRGISGRQFPFRFQQRPGLKNSLGVLKIEMPNQWNVYLHDTPAKALFARPQRGFSHGCVRVQRPDELARRLLNDEAWDAGAIAQGMASGDTHTVPLRRPVPVYLLYWTAFVDADGAVQFRHDLYGRDAPIEAALGLALDRTPVANQSQEPPCEPPAGGLTLETD